MEMLEGMEAEAALQACRCQRELRLQVTYDAICTAGEAGRCAKTHCSSVFVLHRGPESVPCSDLTGLQKCTSQRSSSSPNYFRM